MQGPVTLEALRKAHRAGRIPAGAEIGESPDLFYPLTAMAYLLEERAPPPAPAAVPHRAPPPSVRMSAGPVAPGGSARLPPADARERKPRGPSPRPPAHVASLILALVAVAAAMAALALPDWVVLRPRGPLTGTRYLSFHPVGVTAAGYMLPGHPPGDLVLYEAMLPLIGGLVESDDREAATARGLLFERSPDAHYFLAGELEKTAFVGALGILAAAGSFLMVFLCAAVAVLRRVRVRRDVLVFAALGPLVAAALLGLFPFSGIIGVLAQSEYRTFGLGPGYAFACASVAALLVATVLLAAGNAKHEAWRRRRSR